MKNIFLGMFFFASVLGFSQTQMSASEEHRLKKKYKIRRIKQLQLLPILMRQNT